MPSRAYQAAENDNHFDSKPFELGLVRVAFIVKDQKLKRPNITWFLDLYIS